MTISPKTSFIIPHQGRTEMLEHTLASIFGQTQIDWVEQIIIVTKNTTALHLTHTDERVTILYVPECLTISSQRNIGVEHTSSPYIAFLDADIKLDPDWLQVCFGLLQDDPARVIVSAKQICNPQATALEQVRAALSNIAEDQPVQFLTGRNLLLSRQSFDLSGGFPEELQTCEDYIFTEKVSQQGTLYYTSQTHYEHLGEDKSYRETFRKERWRSAYNLLSLRGRSIQLAEWPSILLPFWFMLATLIFMISLLSANGCWALVALGAWVTPVALYSVRLFKATGSSLPFIDIVKFYSVYFAGRMLGTVMGLPKLWLPQPVRKIQIPQQEPQPIKVLEFICPAGFYGAERWIIALAKGALQSSEISNASAERVQYQLAVTNETQEPLEVSEHFQALGLPCHDIPLTSRFDLRAISKLVELIKRENIDIIHTHGYKSDILGVLAAKLAGIPSVCTPHGFENAQDWKLRCYLWLGGKSFRFFDTLCPLSPQIAQDLLNIYGVPQKRIHTILNGVDLSEVEETIEQNVSDNTTENTAEKQEAFIIGYIGQLISRKNITAMLESFALFVPHCPPAKLQLIGDGEEREALQAQAQALGISEQVEFLGFKDNRLDWLKQFDIFTMTSSLEGIPRCMMEAMAMGIPLTGFAIPGVNDLIQPDETGLSCPFNDCPALANSWLKLYQNRDLGERLAKNSKAYVYQQFSAQRMAKDYETLFYQMAGPVSIQSHSAMIEAQNPTQDQ